MANYTHIFDSQWPEELITLTDYKDADNVVGSLIQQIRAAQATGDYETAQEIIDTNINVLKRYVQDSSAINRYVEEIRNLEIYAKSHKQQIYYQRNDPEDYISENDVWIGDYTV